MAKQVRNAATFQRLFEPSFERNLKSTSKFIIKGMKKWSQKTDQIFITVHFRACVAHSCTTPPE